MALLLESWLLAWAKLTQSGRVGIGRKENMMTLDVFIGIPLSDGPRFSWKPQ
jgi:hypothetical protein